MAENTAPVRRIVHISLLEYGGQLEAELNGPGVPRVRVDQIRTAPQLGGPHLNAAGFTVHASGREELTGILRKIRQATGSRPPMAVVVMRSGANFEYAKNWQEHYLNLAIIRQLPGKKTAAEAASKLSSHFKKHVAGH